MDGTETLQLSRTAVLFPWAEASLAQRGQLPGTSEDWLLTQWDTRGGSWVLDADAAALLGNFHIASTAIDAIVREAERQDTSAEVLLPDALRFVSRMIDLGILRPTATASTTTGGADSLPDALAQRWPNRTALRLLKDTQVYRCEAQADGGPRVVLKVVAGEAPSWVSAALANEERILEHSSCSVVPTLVDAGQVGQVRWIATTWMPGLHPDALCDGIRRPWEAAASRALGEICVGILDAYVDLHEHGLVHADVAPGNILVDPQSRTVHIVDLGFSRLTADARTPCGGGVLPYLDPRVAAARLARTEAPSADEKTDQYGVAAVLFRLLTGHAHVRATLAERDVVRAVAASEIRSFLDCGVPAQPDVESVLRRALDVDPTRRYPSMSDLHQDFARALANGDRRRRVSERPTGAAVLFDHVAARLVDREYIRRDLPAPSASINYGRAGIAGALLSAALLSGRADLLSAAAAWATEAERDVSRDRAHALFDPDIEITPATVGRSGLYHSPAGVFVVRALAACACNDAQLAGASTDAFLGFACGDVQRADLTTGLAGRLLGAALLYAARPSVPLGEYGDRLLEHFVTAFDPESAPRGCNQAYLGIAHGWGGIYYAALCWSRARNTPPPQWLYEGVEGICGFVRVSGSGAAWPVTGRGGTPWRGWCHGSAGYVHLLLMGAVVLGRPDLIEIAVAAGDYACQHMPAGSLCCGSTGSGFAALALFRATGDGRWVDRARAMSRHATSLVETRAMRTDSLYKGDIGAAVLELALRSPACAAQPLFGLPLYD